MFRLPAFLSVLLVVSLITSCSTVKQTDPEKEVRAFISQFEKNLAATDEVIIRQFQLLPDSGVTTAGILKSIRIMQNAAQAQDSIACALDFSGAFIYPGESAVRVAITAQFTSLDPAFDTKKKSTLTLWISTTDDGAFISGIDAERFYFDYTDAVQNLRHRKNREKDIATRKIFFNQAAQLQNTYDSVIWYTQYRDSIYYYVVNGPWSSRLLDETAVRDSVNMGLVSESGRVIVPPEYELVGTIGFELDNIIEVKKNGRVGHFNMEGRALVPALYEWIIPYPHADVYALAKQDSLYGWIDTHFAWHAGFPSAEAEKYVHEFSYLDPFREISKHTTTMIEILSTDDYVYGIVIPAQHFVSSGVLSEVIPHVHLPESDYGGVEKIETQKTFFENITDNLSAFIVTLNEYYVGGREQFYKRNNFTIADNEGVALTTFVIREGDVQINRPDSTLLEVCSSVSADFSGAVPYRDTDDGEEGYLLRPSFEYFRIEENAITAVPSHRRYEFTALVKLDSAYVTGKFLAFEQGQLKSEVPMLFPPADIQRMRDEILADYGYIFTDEKASRLFERKPWYKPQFHNYSDFLGSMTETDRYNLGFLEKIIGTRDGAVSI